ncbi:MAG: restriction endonuclease subunit S [Treponema sp.]|nr:restriction endonuclease subunit S [Treponema sp.]
MNTKALRQKVLDLAIHGKLIPQNPNDESAEVLLKKIREEKAEKIKKGELKADKKDSFIFVGSDKRHYEQFADGTVKDIEDEIPFDVPEGWAWCRLGEICDYGKCINVDTKELKPEDWILDLEDIEKESGKIIKFITFSERKSESTKHKFFKGQVLYSKLRPYLNKVVIAPKDGFCTSEILPLNFKKVLISKYAQCLLMSSYFLSTVNMLTYGVKMPRLGTEDAKKLLLPIPPKNEQENIVNSFEQIFTQINLLENDKEELQTSIKQAKSKILDLAIHGKLVPQDSNDEPAEKLLKRIATSDNRPYKKLSGDEIPFELPETWIWQKLPDLCSIPITDGTHKTPTYSDKENGIPFLSSKDVTSGEIDWSKIKYITKELHEELYKRLAPQKNDILLAKNGTTGIAALVRDDTVFDIYVTLALIRPISGLIIPQYLLYIINSPFCKNQFNAHLTGIGVPNLHLVDINKTVIPLPPINEQVRIVSKIEELFAYTDIINISIKDS